MFRGAEDRQVRWAKEHFPLLALRSDAEVRRVVRMARERMRFVQFAITLVGCVLGLLLANWIKNRWLGGAFSESEEFLFLVAASALLGGGSGIASQVLLRKRIEMIANDT